MIAIAVAVACGDVGASTIVNLTWSIADATCVECTDAVVDVVTNAIGISVCHAVAATHAEGVELIAIAVTVPCGDVGASTIVNLTRAVAHAASIKRAHAVVDVVTDAVGIGVGCTVATTHAQSIFLIAIAIAVAGGDVRTSTLVDLTRTVAHAACVEFAHAVVHVVTDAIGIHIRSAVTTAHAQGVELVSVAVAVTYRDAVTAAHTALVLLEASAVVHSGICIVVARCGICTAWNIILT